MDPHYKDMIKEWAEAGRQSVAHAHLYGSEIDLNNADQVIAVLYLHDHMRWMTVPRAAGVQPQPVGEKVWHIERPKEGSFTTVYCQRELKTIAPYTLPVDSIFVHNGKITVCRECFFDLIRHMQLGDPDVEKPGEVTPLTTNN